MKTYELHTDYSHGWLAVPLDEVMRFKDISTFSYVDYSNRIAYLEEDCDMWIFVNDYIKTHGEHPKVITINDGVCSFIRRLQSYNVNQII